MHSNVLTLLLLLSISKPSNGYINCINSFNGRSFGVLQCANNYCKKYTGSSGIVQLSCDDTGDCKRSFERSFIGPVQMYVCMSDQSTRQTCCCNYDFCNGSSNNNIIYFIIVFISILNYSLLDYLLTPLLGIAFYQFWHLPVVPISR